MALLQLFLCPADPTCSRRLLSGVLDPTDELVARQGRYVPPSMECRRVADQRLAQIWGELVHHPTGNLLAAHKARLTVEETKLFRQTPRDPTTVREKQVRFLRHPA